MPFVFQTHFNKADVCVTPCVLSGVSESEFLTYKGSYGSTLASELGPEVGSASVKLEGRGTTKLQSCFGKLMKEEVDVKKLLLDSSNRCDTMFFFFKVFLKFSHMQLIIRE